MGKAAKTIKNYKVTRRTAKNQVIKLKHYLTKRKSFKLKNRNQVY